MSGYVLPANNLLAAPGDTGSGFSPAIWGNHSIQDRIRKKQIHGAWYEPDFQAAAVLTTPTITTQAIYGLGLKAFGSAGGTLVHSAAEGTPLVLTESDDDQGVNIAMVCLPFKIINDTYGSFWFETRLKTNTIADTSNGLFVGLMGSQTLSATVPIAAAGTLADNNFVGFHRLESDGDQIDCVYKADSVTQVTKEADSLHTALVADTYTKLGMWYDARSKYFHWYQNGLLLTKHLIIDTAGTDFPNDAFMGVCIAMLCASNDDAICTVNWIKAYQSYENKY